MMVHRKIGIIDALEFGPSARQRDICKPRTAERDLFACVPYIHPEPSTALPFRLLNHVHSLTWIMARLRLHGVEVPNQLDEWCMRPL